jgi:LmbE family N-acetylglucosaminyl deacetylase
MIRILLTAGLLAAAAALSAQPVYPYGHPTQDGSAQLREDLRALRVLGSVLYVAAHPDDENTRLIAWLAGEKRVRTTYLSLTRGDGGQNLIGPEIRDLLGVLRTQELLMARGVDGGEQLFSRANDFGYSKHPDETFAIWDRDAVLADAVWAIRRTRPDVIINRFDHRSPGRTHGHHTASAILALEAYALAGDPQAYPEQLAFVDPWRPQRIFFNTSWWFYGSREAFEEADKGSMVSVDAGAYHEARGLSYTEIAARSRSQHKCQGFGSTGTRGEEREYLEFLEGVPLPEGAEDPFAGLSLGWDRLRGGASVDEALARAEAAFDPDRPEACVPALLDAVEAMRRFAGDPRVDHRIAKGEDLARRCLGLWFEARAERPLAVPGDSLAVEVELTLRRPAGLEVEALWLDGPGGVRLAGGGPSAEGPLAEGVPRTLTLRTLLPADLAWSTAYWLQQPGDLGTFRVDEPRLRGLPVSPAPLRAGLTLGLGERRWTLRAPVVHTRNDRVAGEVYRPFELVPPATMQLDRSVHLFADEAPRAVNVRVRAHRPNVSGRVLVELPGDAPWTVSGEARFALEAIDDEAVVTLFLQPRPGTGSATAEAAFRLAIDGRDEALPFALASVAYDHIPEQTVLMPATARLARLDLRVRAKRIGYVTGAGDDVPAALEAIGCTVTELDDAFLDAPDLAARLDAFDAVVVGVRAFNTRERLAHAHPAILDWVAGGGTCVVQYNTNRGLVTEELGPYPLTLSRDRVTVEEAPVTLLEPEHPALTTPNRITVADFNGWVQERGLYFPDAWDSAYSAPLASADPGSDPLPGGLLVARHGEGWYVYTGYSFFRELPAGVPGAFRLFANLISLGHDGKTH